MDRSLGDGGMALLGRLGVSFERYGEGWVEATWVPTEDGVQPGSGRSTAGSTRSCTMRR